MHCRLASNQNATLSSKKWCWENLTGCGAHPASYLMGTDSNLPRTNSTRVPDRPVAFT